MVKLIKLIASKSVAHTTGQVKLSGQYGYASVKWSLTNPQDDVRVTQVVTMQEEASFESGGSLWLESDYKT